MRTKNTDLKDVWQTPTWVIEMVGHIDLDPCAGDNTEIGETNISPPSNGLEYEWVGRVFVNPPFSEKEKWLKKARDCSAECVFVVTPDSTDTISWWHKYIAEGADYIWFSEGRISYVNPETGEKANQPTFGTAISIFGEPGANTLSKMDKMGHLVENVEVFKE